MRSESIRRSLGWTAALLLAGSITTAALAAPERPEMPGDRELCLTVLFKSNPGGR
jgi:hypothetical protein